MAEGLAAERLHHDVDELGEILVVGRVGGCILVPRSDRVQLVADLEVLYPARLVAAHQANAKAAAQHVVHGGNVLGHA